MMKTLSNARTIFAAAAFFALPMVAKADTDKTNPVTGETETYVNTFTGGADGTATEWNSTDNWDPSVTPFIATTIATTYTSSLVSNKTVSTSTAIDGWNLQVGAYNGAAITWNSLGKIQGDTNMWLTVDATSSITINGWGGGNLGQNGKNLNYYVAAQNGVTWGVNLASGTDQGLTMNYYLAGSGSVSFKSLDRASHVIKQADFTLTGTSQVSSKPLVSFASTTKTFTADATIEVYGIDGTTLKKLVSVGSVRAAGTAMGSASSILTTASPVGSCEIVQCTDGIVLYYVDGDYPSSAAYKPSISVNFTSGTALSAVGDVGVGEYAIPGTSWNNVIGNAGTLSTVKQVDSTGTASAADSVSVTISGTRGYWTCGSVNAAADLRQGYIDDAAGANASPQVAISGIPYYSYYAVVYFSNNDPNVKFGYVTINGTNYKWDSDKNALAECEGAASDMWGASSPTAWTEGGNYIVTPTFVNSDGSFTIVGHRLTSGGVTARSGIAAIQIVEVPKVAEEGELVINVSGDTTYTVDANATYTTVYATGTGTLSFSGSGVITTTTFNIGNGVTMPMDTTHLSPATVTGSGTVVYDGVIPPTDKGWTDSANWKGTVWVKNKSQFNAVVPGTFENANSTLRLTGVSGYFNNGDNTAESAGTLELVDDGDTKAFTVANGFSRAGVTKFAKLAGDGTLTQSNHDIFQRYVFTDPSAFTGNIDIPAGTGPLGNGGNRPLRVILGDTTEDSGYGTITIASGATATIAAGKTWNVANKIVVNGTLNVNGTLDSDSTTDAVTGSGTVVFTGRAPTPTGDAWWKNANWTGTVELNAAIAIAGWEFNYYGHSGSTLRLNNCRGWLKNNYTCAPALEIGGVFTWNDGSSGLNNTFKVGTLKGSGTISIPTGGAPTAVWQITDDWSGFMGAVVGNNTDGRRVLVFGPTLPATVEAGEIYVSDGATLNLGNASAAWWTLGKGFVVDGTVVSPNRDKWGGGTAMTLGDTGVLELTSTANKEDYADYSGVTGTGTIKYSSTAGWRVFPSDDAKMPATTLTVQVELADSLIITKNNNGTTTIGNLAGSKNIRSDWSSVSGGANARTLTVTQSKDTEWQGKFVSNRITQFNVNPGASTTGTLTLSGTNTVSIPLTVSGSVNLTGTWVGDTTVSGTIGGTGTLTGNLTFNAGSIFKAFASDENGLSVSGSIAYPASGTVTVDVSALDAPAAKVVLLTAASESDIDLSKFALADGTDQKYGLAKESEKLVLVQEFLLVQRAGGVLPVKVVATDELLKLLESSGLSTATASDVNKFLNAIDPNGLLRWENLATGTATNQPPLGTVSAETANGNALTLSVKMVADTNGIDKVDFGYTVLRELRKGSGETWTSEQGPVSDGTAFDIGLLDSVGTSLNAAGLYRVVTLLAYESVTNEIPSTNAIGIVEVASTATNTITAVPWKRLASAPGKVSDLTVSDFVAYANLSAGDKVYMLDGRDYKMWTKGSDDTWGNATTVSGAGVSEPDAPDVATIPCGGAVWVQRTDATKPYFLVGQYDESAFSVTVPGTNTVLIANPFSTNVTLNAIDWGKYTSVSNDTIRFIPSNGVNVELSYDSTEQKWGYYTPKTNGTSITGVEFNSYNATIPPGTGFIYVRKGDEFTFEWK